jgi:hypothetical protein
VLYSFFGYHQVLGCKLDAKLKASYRALDEAQAEIADLKAKTNQEIEAAIKSAKKAVMQAKAETSKAEDMLAKNVADQAAREKKIQSRLKEMSATFGGRCQKYWR